MRILICTQEAPLPPVNGLRLQVFALARELRKNHEVRVLAVSSPDQADEETPEWLRLVARPVIPVPAALLKATIRRRPTGLVELAGAMVPALGDAIAQFRPDVVHVTPGRLAAIGRHLSGVPSVLAALDAWHLNVAAQADAARGLARLVYRDEVIRAKRFEATEYGRFGRVVVVSEPDRAALLELGPSLRVEVVPNGVDAAAFSPDPSVVREPRLILFTGVMSYPPNVAAAEFLATRVLPVVRTAVPDARLSLVGRQPAPEVRGLERLDGVEVVGEVPDMRHWLSRGGAYACPMVSGTGMKNKLLEAMANGLACVATPLAMQGLEVTSGREVLIGDDADALAGRLVSVLTDAALAVRLGGAAQEYVRRRHDWRAVARAYENLYLDVLSGAPA